MIFESISSSELKIKGDDRGMKWGHRSNLLLKARVPLVLLILAVTKYSFSRAEVKQYISRGHALLLTNLQTKPRY